MICLECSGSDFVVVTNLDFSTLGCLGMFQCLDCGRYLFDEDKSSDLEAKE